jgi:hypothetical protein
MAAAAISHLRRDAPPLLLLRGDRSGLAPPLLLPRRGCSARCLRAPPPLHDGGLRHILLGGPLQTAALRPLPHRRRRPLTLGPAARVAPEHPATAGGGARVRGGAPAGDAGVPGGGVAGSEGGSGSGEDQGGVAGGEGGVVAAQPRDRQLLRQPRGDGSNE